jgi:hypothetical protein
MAEETQYTANNGMATISTANSNLDGSGTIGTVLTGASNGTLIKSVWIKAQTTTSQGMVRLFITGGGNTRLLQEIYVPAVTPSATDRSFEVKLNLNYTLQSGYVLGASTEQANTFGIVAEGMDWTYYSGGVRSDSTQYTAITGLGSLSVANAKLDGTGTIVSLFNYHAAKGITIEAVTIKATVNTTPGMIRLYLQDSGATKTILFTEVHVPSNTKSGKVNAFEYTIAFEDDFELQDNYSLFASTEKGESFKVTVVGLARAYAA